MAFIPTPQVAKVVLEGTFAGTPIVNTLWFEGATNFSSGQLLSLADGVKSWWNNHTQPLYSTLYQLVSIKAYDMSSEFGPTVTLPVGENGLAAGAVGSAQDCIVISLRTNNRGRSSRGRYYFSPIRESELDSQVTNATLRAALLTAFAALEAEVDPFIAVTHVIVSYFVGGVPRLNGFAQEVITRVIVDQFAKTMKRRRQP